MLERSGTVAETEGHDQILEQAVARAEGRLPLVTFLYPEAVERRDDIEIREDARSREVGRCFGD